MSGLPAREEDGLSETPLATRELAPRGRNAVDLHRRA